MLACAAMLAQARPAHAQVSEDSPDRIDLGLWREGALLVGSAIGLSLAPFISVDTTPRPSTPEWLPLDERVRRNFSLRADRLSDATITITLAAPVLLHLPVSGAAGERVLVYGESVAVNLGLVQLVKYLVQRPRPFTHSEDPRIRGFAARRGTDSYVSFFSSHASTSFTAAVSGAYLFAQQSANEGARAAVWGTSIALAAATANWRVRAGRHYYSDIAVGTLIGTGIGIGIPLLHLRDPGAYTPSAAEWGAMAGGLVLGIAVSQLTPLESDPGGVAERALSNLRLLPMAGPDALGLLLAGQL